jgi:hypothetical protein
MSMHKPVRDHIQPRWMYLVRFLKEGSDLWFWLIVAVDVWLIVYDVIHYAGLTASPPTRVRWFGIFSQFVGLTTVVIGLNESRELFEKPSLWLTFRKWIGLLRYVIIPEKTHTVFSATTTPVSLTTNASTMKIRKANDTLENRVANLESGLEAVEENVDTLRNDLDRAKVESHNLISNERTERQSDVGKIRRQIEASTIGGINLEIAGTLFLFVGILCAHAPDEVAWLFGHIGMLASGQ